MYASSIPLLLDFLENVKSQTATVGGGGKLGLHLGRRTVCIVSVVAHRDCLDGSYLGDRDGFEYGLGGYEYQCLDL